MDLFKLLGTIAIDNSEANSALKETSQNAKNTADTIGKGNQQTQNSNKNTGSSWSNLKSKVNEYKAQGMSTSQAWRQANADMKSSAEGAGNGMVGAFAKVGAAVGTFLAVDKIKDFGLGCIQAAADASAMESQFSQVFGDLEGKASKSLTSIADTSGISENRMKGSFTKIAAFAKTTGMETGDALALSERAMVAVADSAAFYDRSLEDTTESLQSFLKGNYENDAALGLSCTETTRNAAANELYGKSFNELSESQKQLTLLKMVEDANKASGALGQAARESDTWTNVLGNLKQGWTDFMAVVGSAILPKAVQVVKGMASAVAGLAEKTKDAIQWLKEHETTAKVLGIAFGTVVAAIGAYVLSLNAGAIATGIMTTLTSALAGVMAFLTSPVTLAVLAIGALVAAFVVAYNKSETFRNIVDKLKDGLVSGFNKIKDGASQLKDKLSEAWDSIVQKCQPVIDAIQKNLVGAFNDLKQAGQGVRDAFDGLKEKFQPIADFLSGAFASAASSASGWFDNLTSKVGDFAKGALESLNGKITVVREGFNKFCEFASRLWDNLDPLVTLIRDNLLNSLKNLEEPINTIKEAFGTIGDTIFNHLLPALRDALMPVWESLKSALSGVAGILGGAFVGTLGIAVGAINGIVSAISGFAQAFSGIVQVVSGVFQLIVGIFTLNGEQCNEAIQGIWDGVCKVFGGLWDAVSGFLQGFVDGVVGFFKGLWDTLVGHSIVPDTINGIVDCFAGLWGKVQGLVESFKNGVVNVFNNVKGKAVSAFDSLKDKVSSAASTVKNKVSSAWESVKSKTSSAFTNAKEKASSAFSSLKDKVSSGAASAKDKVSSAWESLKSKTSSAFTSAKEKASSAFASMKSTVSSHASSLASSAGEKFNSMKSKISSAVDSAKSKASSAFNSMKSTISSNVSGAYSTVSSKFDSIKTKISSVMESAKSAVSNAISNMRSKFNFSWSLPRLKLPHVSISGKFSINPPSVPKFSISWYKKAMNEAMLLNNPTIFGYSAASGKFLGGGEAGQEVVAGSNTLMNMIQNAVATQNADLIYYIQKIIDILCDYFPQVVDSLTGMGIVLDDGTLVGRLAPAMDVELGRIRARKDRGR